MIQTRLWCPWCEEELGMLADVNSILNALDTHNCSLDSYENSTLVLITNPDLRIDKDALIISRFNIRTDHKSTDDGSNEDLADDEACVEVMSTDEVRSAVRTAESVHTETVVAYEDSGCDTSDDSRYS